MRASPSAPVSSSGEEGRRATATSTTADGTGAAGEQGPAAPASRAAHTTPTTATSAAKRWFIAGGSVREERLLVPSMEKWNVQTPFESSRIYLALQCTQNTFQSRTDVAEERKVA